MEKLKTFKGCDGWEDEQQHLSVIMSQVQTALQATGERLEEGPTLLSYPGLKQMCYESNCDCCTCYIGDAKNLFIELLVGLCFKGF